MWTEHDNEPRTLAMPMVPPTTIGTVEVHGEPGELYRLLAPGYQPFAFTNPIFVDADGDGEWTPRSAVPETARP